MINVSNIEELYSAINDAANEGKTIVMAPGTYVLSANGPGGTPRPNGGRLDLQKNMSLIGKVNDRNAVKIDSSQLPQASLRVPFSPPVPSPNRTSPIRLGRGTNTVEWLTVIGNPLAVAGIGTDLGDATPATVRVAHVVSGGSLRGMDLRNSGSAMAGRKLTAEIEDNDFSSLGPQPGDPPRQGIRLENFIGATGAEIHAKMSGNRFHGSLYGCMLLNNKTNSGVIIARSNGDTFENNTLSGCWTGGGFASAAAPVGTFSGSSSTFEAHGGKFQNNGEYGILAEGAEARDTTNVLFDNKAFVKLFGCTASNNAQGDLKAYGARSIPPVGIAGTNNVVTIERHGVSTQITVDRDDSEPDEPAGTNKVILLS
jgi:hypothetical protein